MRFNTFANQDSRTTPIHLFPSCRTTPIEDINRVCGDSYQCYFDYVVSLKRDFAVMTKYYQDQFVNIKGDGLQEGAFVRALGRGSVGSLGLGGTLEGRARL